MKIKNNTLLILIMLLLFPIRPIKAENNGNASLDLVLETTTLNMYSNIDLSEDGNYLAAAVPGDVILFNLTKPFALSSITQWTIPQTTPSAVKISGDGSKIIYTDLDDDRVYCYSKDDGITPIWEYISPGHTSGVTYISENGEYAIYMDSNPYSTIYFVNATDGTQFWERWINMNLGITEISNDGKVMVQLQNNTLLYCDTTGLLWQKDFDDDLKGGDLSENGNILVNTKGEMNNLTMYDSSGTKIWEVIDLPIADWFGCASAQRSDEIIVGGTDENHTIFGYDSSSTTPLWGIAGSEYNQTRVVISDDGKIAAAADKGGNIRIIDVQTGQILLTQESQKVIKNLEIDSDGSTIAAFYDDGTIFIFSATPSQPGPTESPTFIDNIVETITDKDNLYALILALLVGFILGAIIFGAGKKKKKPGKKSK